MDKRGGKILLVCMIKHHVRSEAVGTEFYDKKPIRSKDKLMLMRISAYLEYNYLPSNDSRNSPPELAAAPSLNQSLQLAAGQTQPASRVQQQQFNSQSYNNQRQDPYNQATNKQQHNANGGEFNDDSRQREKNRFLPVSLDSLKEQRIDDTHFEYHLYLNCSTLNLKFVRSLLPVERIHVEEIDLELKPTHKKESKCVVKLPEQGLFSADIINANDNNLAHYHCNQPLRLPCYHYSSKSKRSPILLAELHIRAIEFETGNHTTNSISYDSRKFLTNKKTDCESPSGNKPAT